MMSWCDKLPSTPTVGFKLTAHFAPLETILDALSPILDAIGEGDAKNITLDQSQTFFSTGFTGNEGFRYQVDENKISVGFSHRVRFRQVSGGPPTMEMLSKPLPFTKLVPIVASKLIDATLMLPKAKDRLVQRIGIISTTAVAEEDIPPGIKRLISYIGRPWKAAVDNYNIGLTGIISETAETTERCIHTLIKPEEKDQLLTLQFDWQRIFQTGWQNTKANLDRLIEDGTRDALKYFEELAEGNRFDEVLLRDATGT
jgi:hypothetical protein